ncbi:MAG: HAD-superfamily hydrolase, subfamily variant 3 [Symbiobacteriaceae bacterium]|jgi:HAD superfamily hydrolase (TIGR01509 family)|nr:HAD-superfamily hydrolase, subfamily variant 3 [Symbiobacteriaceae bacterium]
MTIRAVFFDAGDTLIHRYALKAERFAWLCRQTGLTLPADPARVLAGARAQERFFQDRRKHADAFSNAWYFRLNQIALAGMGYEGDVDGAAKAILKAVGPMPKTSVVDPEAVPLLGYLRSRGYRLAIVSNWDGTLIDVLRETGLGGYFDAVLDSDVVGSRKPDTRIFDVACAATGVRPEEAVHIGDSPCADVAGALAAGVHPLLLDALDLFGDGFDDLPAFERIALLSDLPAWLEGR